MHKYTLRNWQIYNKSIDDLIVQASVEDGRDSWVDNPIGMSWQFVHMYKHWQEACKNTKRDNLILVSISPNTDQIRRKNHAVNRANILKNLPFTNKVVNFVEYFLTIPTYKFVLSPEGNGIDCHRHYEALLSGCIPIVEDSPKTREKYRGLPILWTKDYSEITAEYLEDQYRNMVDCEYDWSVLFLSSYSPEIQKLIKMRGNFWTQRLANKKWYNENIIPSDILDMYKNEPVVWITMVNAGYMEFLRNFIKFNKLQNINFPLLVFVLDEEAENEVKKMGLPCVRLHSELKKECLTFGTLDYKRVTLKKLDAIRVSLNEFKIPVGYIDTDIALFKDPRTYVNQKIINNPEIDIWCQCDEGICMQSCNGNGCNTICSGFIIIKPHLAHILEYTEQDVLSPHLRHDQDFIRMKIIQKGLKYKLFDREFISNGGYVGFPNKRLPIPDSSMLLHFNWIAGGKEKKDMMKHYKCWVI